MKKFKATYKKTAWLVGETKESNIERTIEARTLSSAKNKARKLEVGGSSRVWYQLVNIVEY